MSISGALAPGRLGAGGQAADWDHSPSCSLDYSKLWDPNTQQLAWSPEYSLLKWSVGLNPYSLAWHILCFFPGAATSFPFLSAHQFPMQFFFPQRNLFCFSQKASYILRLSLSNQTGEPFWWGTGDSSRYAKIYSTGSSIVFCTRTHTQEAHILQICSVYL